MVRSRLASNTAVMRLICPSLAPYLYQLASTLVISLLPFQPTINPGTSKRHRFISRSLKRYLCGASVSGIRNHHGPLIAAGAGKNEKLNTLVVHGARHYHLSKLARRHRVETQRLGLSQWSLARLAQIKKPECTGGEARSRGSLGSIGGRRCPGPISFLATSRASSTCCAWNALNAPARGAIACADSSRNTAARQT
jgi:hypothetical protein